MVTLSHYLSLAAALFIIGAVGVVVRRNALTVLMSIELMLNAANLTFVAFSRFPINAVARFPLREGMIGQPALGGHAAAFFVIAVAAAEASVGLAIIIAVFRRRQTTHVDELTILRDPDQTIDPIPGTPAPAPAAAAHAEAH
jgi:NADH-quinone oxidoreductase subunit K